MSDIGSIGFLAALGFLFVTFMAFVKGIIDQLRNRNKKPKTSTIKPKISNESEDDKEDRELSHEDSEGDSLMSEGDLLFPPEEDD
jgi:flagellar biosynthesis/type III secretory pathway M-ring protein FliF/YscJ